MTEALERSPHDVLIVEDNAQLREALRTAFVDAGAQWVRTAANLGEFRSAMATRVPELIILDFELPDGDGIDALVASEAATPSPIVVAMSGVAGPEAAFRLAQLGVSEYVVKPLDLDVLMLAVQRARARVPNLAPHIRAAVGRISLNRVEELVRNTMVQEALSRSDGSRRGAAKQLDVSRQLLQHMLRKLGG